MIIIIRPISESNSKPLYFLHKSPPSGSTPLRIIASQPPPASPVWSLFDAMTHSTTLQLPSITSLSLPLCVIHGFLLGGKSFPNVQYIHSTGVSWEPKMY